MFGLMLFLLLLVVVVWVAVFLLPQFEMTTLSPFNKISTIICYFTSHSSPHLVASLIDWLFQLKAMWTKNKEDGADQLETQRLIGVYLSLIHNNIQQLTRSSTWLEQCTSTPLSCNASSVPVLTRLAFIAIRHRLLLSCCTFSLNIQSVHKHWH